VGPFFSAFLNASRPLRNSEQMVGLASFVGQFAAGVIKEDVDAHLLASPFSIITFNNKLSFKLSSSGEWNCVFLLPCACSC
jgi:hypothetical protein